MRDSELSEPQRTARDEIHDLLQRHASLVGPSFDGEYEQPVADTVFLDSWVIVAEWTDADGESFLTRITSKDLRNVNRSGLLHEGLYGFED